MKVVCFNINGIRAHDQQLLAVHQQLEPDIIGLQEIKVMDDLFPKDLLSKHYHIVHYGQKSFNGVALYSKYEPEQVIYGFPWYEQQEEQKRLITIDITHPELGKLRIVNAYFPQGDNINNDVKFPNKRVFYHDMFRFIKECPKDRRLIIMGDYNISPLDSDIGIGVINARRWLRTGKCSFQPEERQWMQELYNLNMVDTFRHLYPEAIGMYSWFDYRSGMINDGRGLRIDLIMCSQDLVGNVRQAGIDLDIRRMEKPSDHAPVWTVFKA